MRFIRIEFLSIEQWYICVGIKELHCKAKLLQRTRRLRSQSWHCRSRRLFTHPSRRGLLTRLRLIVSYRLIECILDKLAQFATIVAEIGEAVAFWMQDETCLVGEDKVSPSILVANRRSYSKCCVVLLIHFRLLFYLNHVEIWVVYVLEVPDWNSASRGPWLSEYRLIVHDTEHFFLLVHFDQSVLKIFVAKILEHIKSVNFRWRLLLFCPLLDHV